MFTSMLLSALVAFAPAAVAPQSNHGEQVKEYKEILGDKERESEAIALIDAFLTRYQEHTERMIEIADSIEIEEGDLAALKKEAKELEKAQEELADLIWLSFKERKRDTAGHQRLWQSAAFAFGQMGSHGAEYLWKAYKDKRFKKNDNMLNLLIEQVGATKDYSQWEELVDLLDHHKDATIASAAKALVNYREAPGKVRREVVSKLVNFLNSYYNASTNPEDTTARQRYRMTSRPMLDALSELTGQTFRDPLQWRKWFNDNKKDRDLWSDD